MTKVTVYRWLVNRAGSYFVSERYYATRKDAQQGNKGFRVVCPIEETARIEEPVVIFEPNYKEHIIERRVVNALTPIDCDGSRSFEEALAEAREYLQEELDHYRYNLKMYQRGVKRSSEEIKELEDSLAKFEALTEAVEK